MTLTAQVAALCNTPIYDKRLTVFDRRFMSALCTSTGGGREVRHLSAFQIQWVDDLYKLIFTGKT